MAEILVVDDSPTMRNLVRRVLETRDHKVHEASDGVDGLSQAEKRPFHLVVADINMPRMNGFQMIEAIRDTHSKTDLPVVVLTTETSEDSKEKLREAGANAWVAKPFDDEVFMKILDQFLP
jgi:two-component system chemotaxis response regulator CheY